MEKSRRLIGGRAVRHADDMILLLVAVTISGAGGVLCALMECEVGEPARYLRYAFTGLILLSALGAWVCGHIDTRRPE